MLIAALHAALHFEGRRCRLQAALEEGTHKVTQTSQVNAVNASVSRYCPKCQQIGHCLWRVTLSGRKVKCWVSFIFYFCSRFLYTSSFSKKNISDFFSS